MALLFRHRDLGFTAARDALEVTDGNLATHAKRLEEANFLTARRALTQSGFESRYCITAEGSAAFRAYLEWLRAFLAQSDA